MRRASWISAFSSITRLYPLCLSGLLVLAWGITLYSQALATWQILAGLGIYALMRWNYSRPQPWFSDLLTGLALLPFLGYALEHIVLQKQNPLVELTFFLYILNAIWHGGRAKLHDYWNRQSFLFLLVLLAVNTNLSWISFLLFLLFALVSIPVLALGFLYHQEHQLSELQAPLGKPGHLRPVLYGTLAVMLGSLVLFFLIPRSPFSLFRFPQQTPKPISGYSDQIDLTGDGQIEVDTTLALRIYSESSGWVEAHPAWRYWRGKTLDFFDGKGWRNSLRAEPERLVSAPLSWGKPRMLAEEFMVLIEPSLNREFFYPGQLIVFDPLQVEYRMREDHFPHLWRENESPRRLKYLVKVVPLAAHPLEEAERLRYLGLPLTWPGLVDFRHWLDQALPPAQETPQAFTERLRAHFLANFEGSYRNTFAGEDKLISFLTQEKQGHCEYFASATAIALRMRGVPARVVTGFAGGNWNPLAQTLAFNSEHAHAWVEYYAEGSWHLFDPTVPSARIQPDFRRQNWAAQALDALAFWMERYLVDYTFETQRELVISLVDWSNQEAQLEWKRTQGESLKNRELLWGALGLLVMLWGAWRWYKKREARAFPLPRSYRYVLQRLEALGLPESLAPSPFQRLKAAHAQLSESEQELFQAILNAYYAHRYDDQPFADSEFWAKLQALS